MGPDRGFSLTVKVSRAAETSGPIGAVIEVDREHAEQGRIRVDLSGDLDVFSVPRLRSVFGEIIGSFDVVIDLSGVDFCDSSTLRVFVDAQRRSAGSGHTLELARPSETVRNLFEVSGLSGVLRVTS